MDRYFSLLISFLEWWPVKAVLATIVVLLHVETRHVGALSLLLTIDFITGIYAARKAREQITVRIAYEKTTHKLLKYVAIILACAIAGNSIDWLVLLPNWGEGFVVLTEVTSIIRNAYGERAEDVIKSLRAALGKRLPDHIPSDEEKES